MTSRVQMMPLVLTTLPPKALLISAAVQHVDNSKVKCLTGTTQGSKKHAGLPSVRDESFGTVHLQGQKLTKRSIYLSALLI